MVEARIIKADDWEGLFIDNVLVDEGHSLNEGEERYIYLSGLAEKYGFTPHTLKIHYIAEQDEACLIETGGFPDDMRDLSGDYA